MTFIITTIQYVKHNDSDRKSSEHEVKIPKLQVALGASQKAWVGGSSVFESLVRGGGVFKCLATDGGGSSYFITEIGTIIFLKSDNVTGIVRHAFKFYMH